MGTSDKDDCDPKTPLVFSELTDDEIREIALEKHGVHWAVEVDPGAQVIRPTRDDKPAMIAAWIWLYPDD